MSARTTVAGVILAGGLARRMSNRDKGLILYHGRPLVCYAIDALAGAASEIIISANRNLEQYRLFGPPVVQDQTAGFDGPLAGILTALLHTRAEILVVLPCDSPLVKPEHVRKLLAARADHDADVAAAHDGERLHPVFLALKTALKDSLQNYLASGERRIDRWLEQHQLALADFSATPDIFVNLNTMADLNALEAQSAR
ncbi:molybdenum cofactor guanylyltransferase MobA [Methylomicrobium sp. Wu6]|uniref:molybdenum cofactor guanylyltransferase MobA n=1 Tax=Methylomicrobium sp. Wu6 TaxID=3107928 RepID=UPI002DD629F5|nr:molybdenum cofactor guanylyltransferase MobA [Methylomicrobium sp. Wu6]MEC4749200.1 molybdenum cofactor guanylyltransferase MobA [Methylomicrobium sp. Wu6]